MLVLLQFPTVDDAIRFTSKSKSLKFDFASVRDDNLIAAVYKNTMLTYFTVKDLSNEYNCNGWKVVKYSDDDMQPENGAEDPMMKIIILMEPVMKGMIEYCEEKCINYLLADMQPSKVQAGDCPTSIYLKIPNTKTVCDIINYLIKSNVDLNRSIKIV